LQSVNKLRDRDHRPFALSFQSFWAETPIAVSTALAARVMANTSMAEKAPW